MYELVKVGEKTYYMECPSRVGFYNYEENKVVIIDSGNDKDAGRKVRKILDEQGWELSLIINTHSNADHIGGNRYLQNQTGCKIACSKYENMFINNTILESAFLYGAYPVKELQNKFLMAENSVSEDIDNIELPEGLEIIKLPGHYIDMIGIRTSDNVYFIGDSVANENTINKYHVTYIYDIESYYKTMEDLEKLEGVLYIPSHNEPIKDLKNIIEVNKNMMDDVINKILEICSNPTIFEDLLKKIFDYYNLKINIMQYVLVGSTIKAYLSYLNNRGKIEIVTEDNYIKWKTKIEN